jgi:hypothetical protein
MRMAAGRLVTSEGSMNLPLQTALKSLDSGPVQAALGVVLAALLWWFRIQEQRWLFRSKRAKAFNELLKNDRYLQVSELELHQAMIDAYGKTVERAELAFIMTRTRCAYLLRDRMAAAAHVAFRPACDGWDPRGDGTTAATLTKHGNVSSVVACLASSAALEAAFFAARDSQVLYMLPVALLAMMGVVFFVLSNQFDSASRVLRLDEMFARLIPVPPELRSKRATESAAPARAGRAVVANDPAPEKPARSSRARSPAGRKASGDSVDGTVGS